MSNHATLVPKKNDPEKDKVATPHSLAAALVRELPLGTAGIVLDPSRGAGVFGDVMAKIWPKTYIHGIDIEQEDGGEFSGDFHKWTRRVDWIVTNPPWSDYREFSRHAYRVADNVCYLTTINHDLAMRARLRDMKEAGFGIRRVFTFDTPKAADFPEWPQSGFQLGACWKQRGWNGPTDFIHVPWHDYLEWSIDDAGKLMTEINQPPTP